MTNDNAQPIGDTPLQRRLLAQADAIIARDSDNTSTNNGGAFQVFVKAQYARTDQIWGRISADSCVAACKCPPSNDGKVRHYGWVRRDLDPTKRGQTSRVNGGGNRRKTGAYAPLAGPVTVTTRAKQV